MFWIAFVFTRPFGATFGDLMTRPVAQGGLDLGALQAARVEIALMAAVLGVSILAARRAAPAQIAER